MSYSELNGTCSPASHLTAASLSQGNPSRLSFPSAIFTSRQLMREFASEEHIAELSVSAPGSPKCKLEKS
ncbi:hypothetical protein GB937_003467 [Aspergillus fischeri]|nr:hypothetical protein GB937_003467 [Aspergillus fischeri]